MTRGVQLGALVERYGRGRRRRRLVIVLERGTTWTI
jgi:hypothetical protein